ncbi:MAG: MBL fold metallo-hydrolase [Propionibacteriales bacterium]|nr:MBL fold metallo-hydrolase [Propionibacteriales bacterium]
MPTVDIVIDGYPLRANQGVMGFCSALLIEGEKRTLVDVGHVGRRPALLEALEARGLTPKDIDVTVMTHAHWDHAQNFDLFDHAPLLIHNWERKYAHKPHINDWATPQWTGAMIETQSNITEVDEGYEIEPGVSLIHTPGHSPGCLSVLVETDDGVAAITGDVLHYATVALTKTNPLVFWDEKLARTSIERILSESDLIYPGHDRPFRLVGDKIEYQQPMRIDLQGLDPDDPGVVWHRGPWDAWVMPGIEEQKLDDGPAG